MSAIAQWLCTQSIEPYPNRTDSTNGPISPFVSLCYCIRESLETFTATKSVQLDRCVDLSVVAARIGHLV